MERINVVSAPLPFSNKQVKSYAAPGSTILEIVDAQVPIHLRGAVGVIVMINGDIIVRDYWHCVRPKMGTLVNIRIVPQGGGGKKNPIASLLSIVVAIAAPYIGAALGASLGLGVLGTGVLTAGQTAFFSGLVTATVGVVGKMLVSAIAPPPKPSNYGGGSVGNASESPTQFIEGARNSLTPYGVVPVCLGTNRMFPLQAVRPYTESQDNDQYVRQVFTYGWGENVVIDEVKIGETDIGQFTDIEIENKLNGDLHAGIELFSNDVFQEDFSILLQQSDGYTQRTIQPQSDEVVIDITFPRGLAQFNQQGSRNSFRVQLEAQYSVVGADDWSPAATDYKDFSGAVLNIPPAVLRPAAYNYTQVDGSRLDTIVVDKYSGVISIVPGLAQNYTSSGDLRPGTLPANALRIANVRVSTVRIRNSNTFNTTIVMTDIRNISQFENSSSFVPTKTGDSQVTVSSGAIIFNDLDITGSQTEALRKSVRFVFPERGDYEIRLRRLTADTNSDQIFDKAYLTALKSVRYTNPILLQGINGTAVRIKATDQLNGALDQFNCVVSNVIPNYFPDIDEWQPSVTSNPAAIYRYILQGLPNSRRLPDEKIDLPAIEDWFVHCSQQDYTYNRVIDYDTSVDEILRDVCAAGSASPAIVDGKRTIVIDRINDDVTQIFTPRNTWGYSGEMLYPQLPHAFRTTFRNSEKGYVQDERIVYDDGYSADNATLFEELELQYCTNSDLAFKNARRLIATARLRPETHTFMADIENLVSLRGDRVKLEHDIPLIGVGDARIKEVFVDSSDLVTGITLDDTIAIPIAGVYYARIRLSDGTLLYKQVSAAPGEFTQFNFVTPFDIVDTPASGDLVYFVQAGGELDLIITRIEPMDDLSAKITCVDYAPAIFTAESTPIPAFNSNITVPLEFIRPSPPQLEEIQSDEGVLIKNSDGSLISRAVITLENNNEGSVAVEVKVRRSGDTVFTNANVLEATPERVIITGLNDSFRYDIHIRYRRAGTNMFSLPLQINNYLFIGASGIPSDVTGFTISVTGQTALLKWNANPEIDISHYVIRFSRVFSGATWGTAQLLEDNIYENRISVPFVPGTYLIKAVDLLGNMSENATAIITYDPGVLGNVIEILQEDPDFLGFKDNISADGTSIVLADVDNPLGYYYFNNSIDLGAIFTSFVTASVIAEGVANNNIFSMDDLFAESNLFGTGGGEVYDWENVFDIEDIYGISVDAWDVQLEYRVTNDDPDDTASTWTEWLVFNAGNIDFRAIEFRLRLRALNPGISPRVTELRVSIDMPDRIERGEDLIVPDTGTTIAYDPKFISNPAVVITIQDGDAADEIEFTSKSPSGFSFKVYNRVSLSYVTRTYDFIASGYGRENL